MNDEHPQLAGDQNLDKRRALHPPVRQCNPWQANGRHSPDMQHLPPYVTTGGGRRHPGSYTQTRPRQALIPSFITLPAANGD